MEFFIHKKRFAYLSFLFLTFYSAKHIKAQVHSPVDSLIIFELTNGQRITGSVLIEDERKFVVLTSRGTKDTLAKYRIISQRNANKSDFVNGKLIFKNEYPYTYYISPSALPLKKGTGYLSLPLFFCCKSQYGFTDHFSMGVTTSFVLFPFILNARYSAKLFKDVHAAISGDFLKTDWYNPTELNGALYATVTKGSIENNFTISMGKGFVYNPGNTKQSEIVSLSGIKRITPKKSFMGECLFMFRDGPAVSILRAGGIRVSRGKKATWDIGLFSLLEKRLVQGKFNYSTNTWEYKYGWVSQNPWPYINVTYRL
jgi:hypothetical protein